MGCVNSKYLTSHFVNCDKIKLKIISKFLDKKCHICTKKKNIHISNAENNFICSQLTDRWPRLQCSDKSRHHGSKAASR